MESRSVSSQRRMERSCVWEGKCTKEFFWPFHPNLSNLLENNVNPTLCKTLLKAISDNLAFIREW